MRFQVLLFTRVTNTSGARLVGGKLDVMLAGRTANQSYSILQATPSPRIETKSEGNAHMMTRIPELHTEEVFESKIIVEYAVEAKSFELTQAPIPSDSDHTLSDFCRHRRFWETNDPLIKRTAAKIRSSSDNVESYLANAFFWIRDKMKLREPQQTRFGAAHAIRTLSGDCDEMSDLFIAFCRSVGIPSRRVVGVFYHGHAPSEKLFQWHAWSEVNLRDDIWVPFDPSLGFFASISERHIARCCMGRQSDYPIRKVAWRSNPEKSPTLNHDDIETIIALPE